MAMRVVSNISSVCADLRIELLCTCMTANPTSLAALCLFQYLGLCFRPPAGVDLPFPEMHRHLSMRRVWYRLLKLQVVKNALVQLLLRATAVPHLVVVGVEAHPMVPELLQAVRVDILQHARGAPRDLPALPHALDLALAPSLVLALHVVVIVCPAARADEERGAQKRRGAGTDLLDRGYRVGQRRRVDDDAVVEDGFPARHCGCFSAAGRIEEMACTVARVRA